MKDTQINRRFITTAIAAIAICLSSMHARAAYPAPEYTGPAGNVQFPASFKPFSPPVDTVPARAGAPEIAEWTRSNQPGDTMALTGYKLSSYTGNSEGRDTRFAVFGQTEVSSVTADAAIQRLDGMQVALTLPAALPDNSLYLMWPHNSSGFGEPVAINQAEIWWLGFDKAAPGEVFSVYGRNLQLGNGKSYLYIDSYGWVESVSANPYKADFVVPNNLSKGSHRVYAHNGHGREFGWSKVQTLDVWSGFQFSDNKATWINVKAYGAKGNGSADDIEAINAAISAAKAKPFSTLYFPAGTYLFSSHINIWNLNNSIRIIGDGMDRTKLVPYAALGSYPLLNIRQSNVVVENLEVSTGAHNSARAVNVEGCDNTRFLNVRLSSIESDHGEHIIKCIGSSRILFRNCEFLTSYSMWNENVRGIIFDTCEFLGVHDCNSFTGGNASRLSAFNCTVRPYDESDARLGKTWCKGRWLTGSNYGANEWYVGGNTTSNMAPRIGSTRFSSPVSFFNVLGDDPEDADPNWLLMEVGVPNMPAGFDKYRDMKMYITAGSDAHVAYWVRSVDPVAKKAIVKLETWRTPPKDTALGRVDFRDHIDPNSGEQIMFEGGQTRYRGKPVSSSGTQVSFADLSPYISSVGDFTYVVVASGKGLGQMRKVVDVSGNALTVDEPWNVQPDQNSVLIVGNYGCRWVVYDNFLDGIDRTEYSASAGFQITGGGHSLIVDGNTCHETRTGIASYADAHSSFISTDNTVSPVYFNLYSNNELKKNLNGLINYFDVRPGKTLPQAGDVAVLGNVWRKNRLDETRDTAIVNHSADGLLHMAITIFDNNKASNFKNCVAGDPGLRNQVWIGNRFVGNGSGNGMAILGGHVPALRNNSFEKLTTKYTGELPGGVLELPQRVVLLTDKTPSGAIVVQNSGTAGLNWSASSDAAWLEITQKTGQVSDENSAGLIPVRLNSAALPAGDAMAVVTIRSGNQVKQVSVMYDADGNGSSPRTLLNIKISGTEEVEEGKQEIYFCTAYYSDGTGDRIAPVWRVDGSSASILPSGLLSAGIVESDQAVLVNAVHEGMRATFSVKIKNIPPVLTGIDIAGEKIVSEGTRVLYFCTAQYSDGTSKRVSPVWNVQSLYASIYPFGLLDSAFVNSDQAAKISAVFGKFSASMDVVIKDASPVPILRGIKIMGKPTVLEGSRELYTCIASYSDGTSKRVSATWSLDAQSAKIYPFGLVEAALVDGDQPAIIRASFSGWSAELNVTIEDVSQEPTHIEISGLATVGENSQTLYACTAHYPDGSVQSVMPSWNVDVDFASIYPSGLLDCRLVETDQAVNITAAYEGATASYNVTVQTLDELIYPLSGFEGKWLDSYLYDETAKNYIKLGVEYEPDELVVQNLDPSHRYWLGIRMLEESTGAWPLIHGNWIEYENGTITQ